MSQADVLKQHVMMYETRDGCLCLVIVRFIIIMLEKSCDYHVVYIQLDQVISSFQILLMRRSNCFGNIVHNKPLVFTLPTVIMDSYSFDILSDVSGLASFED